MVTSRAARSFLLSTTLVLGAGAASAGNDPEPIVVRVGETSVTASEVKRALVGVPAFELQALGTTRFAILKKYVEEAIVQGELLAQAGRRMGAMSDRAVQLQMRRALASAIVRRELSAVGAKDAIPLSEVQAYYDQHASEYRTPERVRLWHIVVATKEEAEAALAKAKADPTREGWSKLVSEVSLDPYTKRSSGDLGFVSADGKTTEPKVTVHKEVADAAFALKDDEMSKVPVKSAAGFHVLYRRATVPAIVRSLADEAPTIRELLDQQKREAAYKGLLERLRAGKKIETDPDLLPLVSVDVGARPVPRPRRAP